MQLRITKDLRMWTLYNSKYRRWYLEYLLRTFDVLGSPALLCRFGNHQRSFLPCWPFQPHTHAINSDQLRPPEFLLVLDNQRLTLADCESSLQRSRVNHSIDLQNQPDWSEYWGAWPVTFRLWGARQIGHSGLKCCLRQSLWKDRCSQFGSSTCWPGANGSKQITHSSAVSDIWT